jgi:hypothetical protein
LVDERLQGVHREPQHRHRASVWFNEQQLVSRRRPQLYAWRAGIRGSSW